MGVNFINNGGRVDGGKRGESLGRMDNSKEGVCDVISDEEGGCSTAVYGATSTAVKEEVLR